MKILQLSKHYPPTHGGLEIVAEFFSRACQDLGHETFVVSTGDKTLTYRGQFSETVFQGRENLKLNSSPLSIEYVRQVIDLVQSQSIEIILVHLPNPLAHEICKWIGPTISSKKIKIIGIYHSDIINQVVLRDLYNLYFKNHLSLYDFFVCSSPQLQASSVILSQVKEDQIRVIPFCIDPGLPQAPRGDKRFQGKFISIGRMVPYKGYEFLIRAFNDLPYELTIVGTGPLESSLKIIAGKNIKFLGSVSEEKKFELLNDSDALVMSSINRAEAFGMTIVEAFSVGLPVISSKIDTGVSFLARHEVTGLTFEVLDALDLRRQIERFASSALLRRDLSKNAYEFFQNTLSYPAFKGNVHSLLKELE